MFKLKKSLVWILGIVAVIIAGAMIITASGLPVRRQAAPANPEIPATGTESGLMIPASSTPDEAPVLTVGTSSVGSASGISTSSPILTAASDTPASLGGASGTTSLANPASTNCTAKGGQLEIMNKPDGSQYGLCYFDDNRACEEWAMFRGDCPVGGRKTTGYDTDAQKYCAWAGGTTLAEANATCTFKDGSTCSDEAFYAGTCLPKSRQIN